MQKDLEKLSNQARFIQMIIDGKLVVSKKKKKDLVAELKQKNFKPFPKVVDAVKEGELEPVLDNDEEAEEDVEIGANAFDYLLGVSISTCSYGAKANNMLDGHLVSDQGARREASSTNRGQRNGDR